ncbi:MAG: hypothetical protein V7607_5420 [Solirubrobacteraceae bacterium]
MKPWVLWVLMLIILFPAAYAAWLRRVLQGDARDKMLVIAARAGQLARSRQRIHGPAYPGCPRRQRLWGIPLGQECRECAAHTRAGRDLRKEMPVSLRISGGIGAAVLRLDRAKRRLDHAAKAGSGPFLPGVVSTPRALVSPASPWRRRQLLQDAKRHRAAAENDNPQAQYNVGLRLAQAGNPAEAMIWYARAADQGMVRAMVNLGDLLFNAGHLQEALSWFTAAADLGDPIGAWNAGNTAAEIGDAMQVHAWRHRAAALGHPKAKEYVKRRTT